MTITNTHLREEGFREHPNDYVAATEDSHMVELLEMAFEYVGLNWKEHIEIDQSYSWPYKVDNSSRFVEEKLLVKHGYIDSHQP